MALRHLRQFSGLVDLPPTEFDVDNTIKDTANNAGSLKVRYKKAPAEHSEGAAVMRRAPAPLPRGRINQFKDIKIYYSLQPSFYRQHPPPTPNNLREKAFKIKRKPGGGTPRWLPTSW